MATADMFNTYGCGTTSIGGSTITPWPRTAESQTGVWIAYYTDGTEAYLFKDEIDALRMAVGQPMKVAFVEWGSALPSFGAEEPAF